MRISSRARTRQFLLVFFAPLLVFALMAVLASIARAQQPGDLLDWACAPDNAALLKTVIGLLGLHLGASVTSALLKKFGDNAGLFTAIVRLVALDLRGTKPPQSKT